jgi:predicted nicotinamide N-methyase
MLESVKKLTKIESPKFVPEISIYRVSNKFGEYPFVPNEFNCMYGYATQSGVALARHILDNADQFNGLDITDIGCGSGIASIAAAKVGANVTSIDRDIASLYFTEQNCKLNEVQTNLVWGSFKDIKTDYVMFSSLFYDKSNMEVIENIILNKKVIIGSLQPNLPDNLPIKLDRIKVKVDADLYVFTNKDHCL